MNIKNVTKAAGLKAEDAELIERMCKVYDAKRAGNILRDKYYNDKTRASDLGLSVPPEFRGINVSIGWCAKAVDRLCARSVIDSFSMAEQGDPSLMESIVAANDLINEYDKAKQAELIHSCGFWTVDAAIDGGLPAVLYHDAASGAALWDYRNRQVKCGIVVYDCETKRNGDVEPSVIHAYLPDKNIVLIRNGKEWSAKYGVNSMGRPMFESMCYRPTDQRPFGKSVISKTCMSITDEMQRELVRTALHSEIFSAPQRYLLGASEEAFTKSKISLYMDAMLIATRDENGEIPVVGQFAQASLEPHIAYMDKLATRFAAETNLPVASLGVSSNGYTSSDALRAASDDIIIEAEAINRMNGKAMRNVIQMALCVAQNKALSDMTDAEKSIVVGFKNPSMPSVSSQADAMVKIASVAPAFAATPTFFEQMGFSEPVRRKLETEMAGNRQLEIAASVFGA